LSQNLAEAPILRVEIYENSSKREHNPNSKYIQKMRAKIEAENRIFELQKLRKENKKQKYLRNFGGLNVGGDPTEEKNHENEEEKHINMQDIIRKALMMRLGKPSDQIFVSHMSPLRINRHRNKDND
jgi:hypothetical protein